jgi:hypothetical protein
MHQEATDVMGAEFSQILDAFGIAPGDKNRELGLVKLARAFGQPPGFAVQQEDVETVVKSNSPSLHGKISFLK